MIDRIGTPASQVRDRAWTPAGARRLGTVALAAGALLLAAAAGPAPAKAQDIRTQVQRLQQELQTLQRHVYGGSSGGAGAAAGAAGGGDLSRPQAARLELRLNQLETQMRGLTGEVEQVGYRIDQVSRRLEEVAADLNARLMRLEQQPLAQAGAPAQTATITPPSPTLGARPEQPGAAAPGGQLAPGETGSQVLGSVPAANLEQLRQQAAGQDAGDATGQAAGAPTQLGTAGQAQAGTQTAAAGAPAGGFASPKAQYDNAFTLLSQANYPAAEKALTDFLVAYPSDPLAGNAKYWLGETYYVRGQYKDAAVTFAEGYQTYPNSAKAPDNLLKLGKSLAALGQTQDACGTLAELLRRYPKAPPNVLQQAQREQDRLGCS